MFIAILAGFIQSGSWILKYIQNFVLVIYEIGLFIYFTFTSDLVRIDPVKNKHKIW